MKTPPLNKNTLNVIAQVYYKCITDREIVYSSAAIPV